MNSSAKLVYARAPTLRGSYSVIGRPWLGASLMRTDRGMIVLYTLSLKKCLTSSTTCTHRFSRAENIVSTTP